MAQVLADCSCAEVDVLAIAEGEEDWRSARERADHLVIDRNAGLRLERQGRSDKGAAVEERRRYAKGECEGILALRGAAVAIASAVAELNLEEAQPTVAQQSRADQTLLGDEEIAADDSGLGLSLAIAGATATSGATTSSGATTVSTAAGTTPAASASRAAGIAGTAIAAAAAPHDKQT